jgi:osmotically-inducible protein OsmY
MCAANERLQSEVLDELRWDPQVDVSAIGVTAIAGVVTLYGEVPSWPTKAAAVDAATRVRGVRAVAEHLTVHCPGSMLHSDTDLARDVADVLRQARCAATIKVQVHDGEVRLEGFVDWPFQRGAAEAAVVSAPPRLFGLKRVANDIVVSRPATLPSILDRTQPFRDIARVAS